MLNESIIDEYVEEFLCNENEGIYTQFNQQHDLSYSTFNNSFNSLETNSQLFDLIPKNVETFLLKSHKITELYDWQKECLNLKELKEWQNVLISLPTSGGKTLISEVITFRHLFFYKKNVLIIVPFISLVHEKAQNLIESASVCNFLVEEYAGSKGAFPPTKRRTNNTVYVATIEKGLSLMYSLIEENRLHELGLVILDEVHYIGDPSRGFYLEIAVMILKHFIKNLKLQIQIIAMSATVGNLSEMAKFLEAKLFIKEFRPIKVFEYVIVENEVYFVNYEKNSMDSVKKFKSILNENDSTGLAQIVTQNFQSCIIFCPTKVSCEIVAKNIFKYLVCLKKIKPVNEDIIIDLLEENDGELCSILKRIIPFGIAYHHSGLSVGERKIIEESYNCGKLWCLCSTSTLAAGVNLPAERIFLKSPYVGNGFITLGTYKQMVGRAGRPGMGLSAQSLLFCSQNDFNNVKTMIFSPMTNCCSHLKNGLATAILASVRLNLVTDFQSLIIFFSNSLLSLQSCENFLNLIKEEIFLLKSNKSLKDSNNLELTNFGKAIVKSNLTLNTAERLMLDLNCAKKSLILMSDFHLLYLVSPSELVHRTTLDLKEVAELILDLSEPNQKVIQTLGINERVLSKLICGLKINEINMDIFKKIYNSIILFEIINNVQIKNILKKFKMRRGDLNNLITSASAYASSVFRFSEEIEIMKCFSKLLSDFPQKIYYSYKKELVELMELPGVRQVRAKQLFNAGFKTMKDVAKSKPEDLINQIRNLHKSQALKMISFAKMKLRAHSEALQIEAEACLEGIEPCLVINEDLMQERSNTIILKFKK